MAFFSLKKLFEDKPYKVSGALPLPFSASIDRYIKRRYAFSGETRLGRKRIFILPTYFGSIYALTILIMLVGSLNYNNNPAFLLTFMLIAIGLVTTFHTYRNLSLLSFRPVKSIPSFAGHSVQYWVLVDNHGGNQRFAIELYAGNESPSIIDVPSNGTSTVHLNLPTHRRGLIPYCVVTVETRFPFGIYRAWSYIKIDASCLVYPKPCNSRSLPPPSPHIHGDKDSTKLGTDDFLGLKMYHPGDSTKHIHWKAYARNQTLLTKQFSLPESDEIWFDWDNLDGLDIETRLSQITRWIIDAEDDNITYGLRIPGVCIDPSLGDKHKHICLKALALYQN